MELSFSLKRYLKANIQQFNKKRLKRISDFEISYLAVSEKIKDVKTLIVSFVAAASKKPETLEDWLDFSAVLLRCLDYPKVCIIL